MKIPDAIFTGRERRKEEIAERRITKRIALYRTHDTPINCLILLEATPVMDEHATRLSEPVEVTFELLPEAKV